MRHLIRKEDGAAAIFIVVFFTILISIIALSFLRIAIQDQQQATNNDLSQSAYDSAGAGLEDAKRALSWYGAHCTATPSAVDTSNCAVYNTSFTTPNNHCNIADLIRSTNTLPGTQLASAHPGETEVIINSNTNDQKLDQAYTCTTITTHTTDFKATATNGKSDTLIPLKTVSGSVDTIELNWFTDVNAGTNTPTFPAALVACPAALPNCLPRPSALPSSSTVPVMRFQLIPVFRPSIDIDKIDADTKTIFLYPSTSAGAATTIPLSAEDIGRNQPKFNAPNAVKCQAALPSGIYDCSIKINILPPANGDITPSHTNTDYYMRLTSIYNNADYQIRLFDSSGTNLLFDNIEPQVDSTGRANNVYRRVQSRVINQTNSNPLRDGGFDLTQGLCKDFNVPIYSNNCPSVSPSLVNP